MATNVNTPLNMNGSQINSLAAATTLTDTATYGQNWNSLLVSLSGALSETFPRFLAGAASFTLVSGTVYVTALPLLSGMSITNITYLVSNTAESGGTHGWYGLLDSTGKVLAVTADQTTTFFTPASTAKTLALSGGPYSVTTSGLYYSAISITATTPGGTAQFNVGGGTAATGATPILYGTAGTQNAPPSVGTTLTITSSANGLYSTVS